MISVQNLLQQLSGNKKIILSVFFLFQCHFLFAQLESNGSIGQAGEEINISLLLPFQFQNLDPNTILNQKDFDRSNLAIDYYRGFYLALDSLKKLGVHIQLQVYDSENDSVAITQVLQVPEFLNSNLVFGPFYPNEFSVINPFIKKHQIPVVSPISPLSLDHFKNPQFIMANNTLEEHARQMAVAAKEELKMKNYIIVRNGLLSEARYTKTFIKVMDSLDKKNTKTEILVSKQKLAPLQALLNKNQENYILVPSSDQAFAITLFKHLNTFKDQYPITLLVHPKWIDFQTIDPELLVRYKVHVSSSFYVDYSNASTQNFVNQYRDIYHTEPQDLAFRGFDQAMYFIQAYLKDNQKMMNKIKPASGLGSIYNYKENRQNSNKNAALFILKYQDFHLKPIR